MSYTYILFAYVVCSWLFSLLSYYVVRWYDIDIFNNNDKEFARLAIFFAPCGSWLIFFIIDVLMFYCVLVPYVWDKFWRKLGL